MRNSILSFFLIFISGISMFSQEFAARILNEKTKDPVPFATIQYASNKGIIANEEGFFQINTAHLDSITISSMGYKARSLKLSEFDEKAIYLTPQVIELSDVFLTDRKLSGLEIVERAKEKVSKNYALDMTKMRFFFRESNLNHVNRFDLDIDESSIEEINQELMDSISASIPKFSDSYKEVLGDLYGNYSDQKIHIIKAANLYNPQSTTSLTKLTDKLDRIFRENVKKDSYLKIKSGLLGVKVDAEELAEDKKEYDQEIAKKELTPEEIEKAENQKRENLIQSANSNIRSVMNAMFWKEDGVFNLFDKLNKYKFEVEGYTYFEDEIVYVVSYEPKRGADFKGKLYVNTSDYGIHRIDYDNVNALKKFRLLGISSVDDVYRGKMIFSKDAEGIYHPKYIEQEEGQSFGIDRPLTLIEKNKNVIGKRKQNELDMDILIGVSQLNKYQLVVYNSEAIESGAYQQLKTAGDFEYQTFKRYDPEFWNGYNIIEPNAAIKEFTALEQD